jgi:hypothetical protein
MAETLSYNGEKDDDGDGDGEATKITLEMRKTDKDSDRSIHRKCLLSLVRSCRNYVRLE